MRAAALTAAVALLLAATPAQSQVRPVTIDDVLGIRTVRDTVIAPDGSAVLFTVRAWHDAKPEGRKDSRTHVWRAPADASSPARQVTYGEKAIPYRRGRPMAGTSASCRPGASAPVRTQRRRSG